jgi:hypothetical protein
MSYLPVPEIERLSETQVWLFILPVGGATSLLNAYL